MRKKVAERRGTIESLDGMISGQVEGTTTIIFADQIDSSRLTTITDLDRLMMFVFDL